MAESAMRTPLSLLHICASHVAADLVNYADHIPLLPFDTQILIANMVLEKIPKPYIYELKILCQIICKPAELCLKGIPSLSVGGLEELPFSCLSSLVRLDLSGCGDWLRTLSFLTGLPTLECLNLRDCWRLSGDCLSFIHQLPRLRCLDLENVYMITDAWASRYIPGMVNLQALNMSGTNISDEFLEVLTYGVRLQSWAAEQDLTATSSDESAGMGSQQYHALDLIFLRLQHTKISEGVIHYFSSLNQLKLLDVRYTDVPGRSLHSIKGKQGLIALPNNSKLLGKTNSILLSVMKGACGCCSKVLDFVTENEKKPIWLRNLEKKSIVKFLQEVSLIRNNPP